MKDYPKISIITPSYNQGQFIEDAILSIKNQNYPNYEHIIIDGGSKDNTLKILKKYPHLKWVSEPDEGQSDALNKGFKIATGDIIGWLNSDDYYLPETFDTVQKELINPKIDAVYANCKFVDKNGAFQRDLISHKPVKWLSLFHCYIPSTTFFFKRAIIDKGIIIDKKMHITMDKEFFAHILFSGYKFKHINKFFAAFRWHDSNKSTDTKNVKKIRAKEGLIIFNRYSAFKLHSYLFYKYCAIILLPIRKILRFFN